MDTLQAYAINMASQGNEKKVFDWDKAVDLIIERHIINASAGLQLDLEWTAGTILRDGQPVKNSYCFLSSTWAIPVLVDEDNGDEIPCYIMESKTKYTEHTMWPKSALNKLKNVERPISNA